MAIDAARHAGRLQMERYERLERIVHKAEHDVVTEVDELSEQLIISAIRDAFPRDSILAEESGRTDVVAAETERRHRFARSACAGRSTRSTSACGSSTRSTAR